MVTETELFECRDLTPVQGDSGGKFYVQGDSRGMVNILGCDSMGHCEEKVFI